MLTIGRTLEGDAGPIVQPIVSSFALSALFVLIAYLAAVRALNRYAGSVVVQFNHFILIALSTCILVRALQAIRGTCVWYTCPLDNLELTLRAVHTSVIGLAVGAVRVQARNLLTCGLVVDFEELRAVYAGGRI